MFDSPIYFWQRIVTPHMANLADALAATGWPVVYVANETMSANRQQMGWSAPLLKHALLRIASSASEVTDMAYSAPASSIHICQGLRGNGLIGVAQQVLARRRLRHWVVMETIDDEGLKGLLKSLLYVWLLFLWRKKLNGILAIGWQTPGWLSARGANVQAIFPFAYFLPETGRPVVAERVRYPTFRFLFVGQLISLKRVDYLIQELARCTEQDFELVVIGNGPMRQVLESQASKLLPGRVRWLGFMPMSDIPQEMANVDCLVLPSRHDGWGAVVSEALMVGTPVVCSDTCGSAGVVRASRVGSVFSADDTGTLSKVLKEVVIKGPISESERNNLTNWAKCLGTHAGAIYLSQIIAYAGGCHTRPDPPWECLDSDQGAAE